MDKRQIPFKIAGIYFVLGVIWIAFSDRVMRIILEGSMFLPIVQTIKGWVYVFSTAVLLYYLVKRSQEKMLKKHFELQKIVEKVNTMIAFDSLTGLPNRSNAIETLNMIRKQSNPASKLAILFINMDRFNNINNTFGHAFGDQVLIQIAERMKKLVNNISNIARINGDEYVIFFPYRNPKNITSLAQRIIEEFDQPMTINDYELRVTASVGIAIFENEIPEAEEMIQAAKLAMYRAKEMGKNNYQTFTKEMNSECYEKMELENELCKALDNDELSIHYQPQIDMVSKRVIGLEALMRWQHPHKGNIPPSKFIPIAEETGLIVPLGEWLFETVCHQMKEWKSREYPIVPVSINLSMRQFLDSNLIRKLEKTLNNTGIDAKYIDIEITESMTLDVEFAIKRLTQLKALGFKLSIDDFGTGYSSLNYLRVFPVDRLKIDQSFVRASTESTSAKIISTIISIAHHLNLTVIAEGVETEEQYLFLLAQKCNEIQGYYFSKPLPIELLEDSILREYGKEFA